MAEADVLNHLRTPYEFPHPTRKQVSKYLHAAKSPAERKVWRDLLNSEAFHKVKHPVASSSRTSRKVDKAVNAKTKRK
jgi:hypothetical protein